MPDTVIDAETAIRMLEEQVAGHEDFVYSPPTKNSLDEPICLYVHDDTPSCLVGRVLHAAGVTLEELAVLDEQALSAIALGLEPFSSVEVTVSGASVLANAQRAQDGGETWGAALEQARRTLAWLTRD